MLHLVHHGLVNAHHGLGAFGVIELIQRHLVGHLRAVFIAVRQAHFAKDHPLLRVDLYQADRRRRELFPARLGHHFQVAVDIHSRGIRLGEFEKFHLSFEAQVFP